MGFAIEFRIEKNKPATELVVMIQSMLVRLFLGWTRRARALTDWKDSKHSLNWYHVQKCDQARLVCPAKCTFLQTPFETACMQVSDKSKAKTAEPEPFSLLLLRPKKFCLMVDLRLREHFLEVRWRPR